MTLLRLHEFDSFSQTTPAQVIRPRPYLRDHLLRFHETYKEAFGLLKVGGSVLSVGAGRAFVECALATSRNAQVTVFDFPEAIERNADQYAKFGFKTHVGNFLDDDIGAQAGGYDLVLFCEVVEHIPIDPAVQFTKLARFLKPGGHLVVSTPNVASASNIVRLIRGTNIIAGPKRLFSPVGAENESVHRREYIMSEISDAMREAGLTVTTTRHIHQRQPNKSPQSLALYGFLSLLAKWRPMMLVVGRKG